MENHEDDEPQILNSVVAILTAIYSGQEEIAQELFEEVDKEEFHAALINLLLSAYTIISKATGIPVEDYLQRLGYLSTIF